MYMYIASHAAYSSSQISQILLLDHGISNDELDKRFDIISLLSLIIQYSCTCRSQGLKQLKLTLGSNVSIHMLHYNDLLI